MAETVTEIRKQYDTWQDIGTLTLGGVRIGTLLAENERLEARLQHAEAVCKAVTVERKPCNDISLKRRRIEATWAALDAYLAGTKENDDGEEN